VRLQRRPDSPRMRGGSLGRQHTPQRQLPLASPAWHRSHGHKRLGPRPARRWACSRFCSRPPRSRGC
jgi:hypothetical protein